jgi:hypothetical protein
VPFAGVTLILSLRGELLDGLPILPDGGCDVLQLGAPFMECRDGAHKPVV